MLKKIPPFDTYSKSQYWQGPSIPLEITFSLSLTGSIDIAKLRNAAKEIFLHTPLLQTRLKDLFIFIRRAYKPEKKSFEIETIFSHYDITKKKNQQSVKEHLQENFINTFIDLYKTPPIRLMTITTSSKNHTVYIKIHHSVTDGYGCVLILSKIFQKYNNALNKTNSKKLPGEPRKISYKPLLKYASDKEMIAQFRQKMMVPASSFRDNKAATGTIRDIHIIIPKKDFATLKKAAQKHKIAINSIINASVVRATYSMIKKKGTDTGFFKLVQTINLRNDLGIDGGITNLSNIFILALETKKIKKRKECLASLDTITKKILATKPYAQNLVIPLKIKLTPAKKLMKQKKQIDTMLINTNPAFSIVMSNMGSADQLLEMPHGCTADYIWALTPPHPSYGIHWGAATINNNLCLHLVYLDPVITEKTAGKLLKNTTKELKEIINILK